MKYFLGVYESFINNCIIDLPDLWLEEIKDKDLICVIHPYVSVDNEHCKKILFTPELRSGDMREDTEEEDVFLIEMKDEKQLRVPEEYLKRSGIATTSDVLLSGEVYHFCIQTKLDKPTMTEEEFEEWMARIEKQEKEDI